MNASVNNLPLQHRITSSGFTLIELMVTIAVLAIITSIAAPSISNQLANQRVKSTTATLATALKEARVESVIRRQEIEVSYNNHGKKPGTIEVEDDNSNMTATYQYDAKSTIKSNGNGKIKFKPNKTTNKTRNYTICDSNEAATPRKITVNKLGTVSIQLGGSC